MSIGIFRFGPRSGLRGHGPSLGRRRYAWPDPTRPVRGRVDPGYLKTFGSRPAHKLKRVREAA